MKQPRVLAGRVVYDGVTGKVPGSEELLFPVSEVGMLAGRGSRLLVVDPRAKVIYWTDAKGRLKHKHGLNELRSVEVSGVSLALRFGEARRVYTLVFESFSQLSHFIASVRPFCVVEGEQGPQQQDSAQHNPLRSLIAPDAPDGGPHPPTVAVEELAEDEVVAATTGRFEVTKYSRCVRREAGGCVARHQLNLCAQTRDRPTANPSAGCREQAARLPGVARPTAPDPAVGAETGTFLPPDLSRPRPPHAAPFPNTALAATAQLLRRAPPQDLLPTGR